MFLPHFSQDSVRRGCIWKKLFPPYCAFRTAGASQANCKSFLLREDCFLFLIRSRKDLRSS